MCVNPDEIAKELNPDNPVAVQIQAGKETLKRIDALLGERKSFAIESTLSGLGYLAVLQKAKASGYETLICYTFVDSPEVCIARIENRVKNGGHFCAVGRCSPPLLSQQKKFFGALFKRS